MNSNTTAGDIETLYVCVCDLNGTLRGKRIPTNKLEGIVSGGVRMPLSGVSVDIWGADLEADGGVFVTGDLDATCMPTERGLLTFDRHGVSSAMLPLWMSKDDGAPYPGDPRHALASIVKRLKEKDLTPVVATELEFYLMDANASAPKPPVSPLTGKHLDSNSVLSVSELQEFESFLNDVYAACKEQNIPAEAAISENGCGQFEVNLLHVNDALKAADDALFFKRVVKSVARQHGMIASFMAKPYGAESGNGFHVHFSLLDSAGKNVFDNGSEEGSDILKYAVGGLLKAMPDSMLIFAPHMNSYRRLLPGTHAPTKASWGYENRTAAIRIPGGDNSARRIEHRVAGADANPYLVLAGILGAALSGIEQQTQPAGPIENSAYDSPGVALPRNWQAAIDGFSNSAQMKKIFDQTLCDLFVSCKKQELEKFEQEVTPFELTTYLEIV